MKNNTTKYTIKTPSAESIPKNLIGGTLEVNIVANPIAEVTAVKNVANPMSFKVR